MQISIAPNLWIDENELTFTFDRSSKPGGQNVNKVSTRVTLVFDVRASRSLSPTQKALITSACAGRMSDDGVLRVASQRHRTQVANRQAVMKRFIELMTSATKPRESRRKTRPTRGSVERRLTSKRRRSTVKRERAGRV